MQIDELDQLACTLSLRILDRQEEALHALRSRTGTLLAASSLVTSLLGLGNRQLDPVGGIALAAFAVTMLSSVWILLPKPGLSFDLPGGAVLEVVDREPPQELGGAYRLVIRGIDQVCASNRSAIEKLDRHFTVAAGGLAIQVLMAVAGFSANLAGT